MVIIDNYYNNNIYIYIYSKVLPIRPPPLIFANEWCGIWFTPPPPPPAPFPLNCFSAGELRGRWPASRCDVNTKAKVQSLVITPALMGGRMCGRPELLYTGYTPPPPPIFACIDGVDGGQYFTVYTIKW